VTSFRCHYVPLNVIPIVDIDESLGGKFIISIDLGL